MQLNRYRAMIVPLALLAFTACGPKKSEAPPALDPVEQLIVWADADPEDGEAPLEVQLTCDPLEDIDGPEYSWDPGDGSGTIEGQNVKHTYQRPGTYKARVTVIDAHGNRGEDEIRVDVELPE